MVGPVNIVMLLTDGFGGFGGIAKFNRDFMEAINAPSLVERVHGIEAWKRWPWLYGLMLKSVDSFIAVSRYSADRFATWSNISNEQSFVLPNCVDLNSLVPEVRDEKLVERYGVRNNKLILTVGRISFQERYKGFEK
jgi:phosphatidylinositol alpha-1,6-mannosyltransferase